MASAQQEGFWSSCHRTSLPQSPLYVTYPPLLLLDTPEKIKRQEKALKQYSRALHKSTRKQKVQEKTSKPAIYTKTNQIPTKLDKQEVFFFKLLTPCVNFHCIMQLYEQCMRLTVLKNTAFRDSWWSTSSSSTSTLCSFLSAFSTHPGQREKHQQSVHLDCRIQFLSYAYAEITMHLSITHI